MEKSLNSMKVSQLKMEAAKAGAVIKSTMKKADIIAAIEAARASEDAVFVEAEVIDEAVENEPKETELQIVCNAGELSANFDALESYVDSILEDYEGWEPSADSEDDVKQCADQKKYLNALANDLDTRRKKVKEQYLKPLNAFETRANGIRNKVKKTSDRLNDVVKAAKKAEQDIKKEALEQYYKAKYELLAPVVPYDRVHEGRWLNKEPKLPKAKEELEAKVDAIATDWENLKSLGLVCFEQAEAHFFNTLNLGEAVAYNNKLVSDRQKIEDMKANIAVEQEAESAPVTAPAPAAPIYEAPPTYAEPICYGEAAPPYAPVPALAPLIQSDPPRPCVMVIDAADTEQMRAIGRFCGSLVPPVTGVFKVGTLEDAYLNEAARREAEYVRVR